MSEMREESRGARHTATGVTRKEMTAHVLSLVTRDESHPRHITPGTRELRQWALANQNAMYLFPNGDGVRYIVYDCTVLRPC